MVSISIKAGWCELSLRAKLRKHPPGLKQFFRPLHTCVLVWEVQVWVWGWVFNRRSTTPRGFSVSLHLGNQIIVLSLLEVFSVLHDTDEMLHHHVSKRYRTLMQAQFNMQHIFLYIICCCNIDVCSILKNYELQLSCHILKMAGWIWRPLVDPICKKYCMITQTVFFFVPQVVN